MKVLLENAILDYSSHESVFNSLGPTGYTIALNVRNVTPELYYSTFPNSWISRYTKQSFVMADPVVDFMYTGSGATRWSAIQHSRGLNKTADFLEISANEGLSFGAAVVARTLKDPTIKSLVSVSRNDRELTDDELTRLEVSFFELLTKIEFGAQLTERQTRILRLMAGGSTRSECAKVLKVSPETVKRDVELVRETLGARNITEAVAIAMARNIISLSDDQTW